MEDLKDMMIMFACGTVIGVCSAVYYYEEQEITPIEDNLNISCVKVGSDLEYYTRDGTLVCKNGAMFEYEVK